MKRFLKLNISFKMLIYFMNELIIEKGLYWRYFILIIGLMEFIIYYDVVLNKERKINVFLFLG